MHSIRKKYNHVQKWNANARNDRLAHNNEANYGILQILNTEK